MLGKPFEEVHRWLDEFAGKPPYGMRHRKLRHHLAGIEQARKLWGVPVIERLLAVLRVLGAMGLYFA